MSWLALLASSVGRSFGAPSAFDTEVKEAKLHDVFLCDLHLSAPLAERRLAPKPTQNLVSFPPLPLLSRPETGGFFISSTQ